MERSSCNKPQKRKDFMVFTVTTTKTNKQNQTSQEASNQTNRQTNKQTKMKQNQSRSKLGVRGDVSRFQREPFIVVGDEVRILQNYCFFRFILESTDAQNYC